MINKNFKFRIKNKYHSIQLQEQLFKCGYRWIDSNNTRSEFEFKDLTSKDFIFASSIRYLFNISSEEKFKSSDFEEITLSRLKAKYITNGYNFFENNQDQNILKRPQCGKFDIIKP